jgi:hypothetical protein
MKKPTMDFKKNKKKPSRDFATLVEKMTSKYGQSGDRNGDRKSGKNNEGFTKRGQKWGPVNGRQRSIRA